jgi:nucleoside-diphosphate-sugar epimerase/predicted dehydrogenase
MPQARLLNQDFRAVLDALDPLPSGHRELVIVALPNHLHVEACELALRKGRDVLCEKPLSLSVADCRKLDALATEVGCRLSVALVRRWLPSFILAREILEAGEIGRIVAAEVIDRAEFGWRPRSLGFFAPTAGGVLADMGVHYLDFLDQVLGPMTPLSYTDDWRGGNESNCTLRMAASGVPVNLVLSRTQRGQTHIRFKGEAGTLTLSKEDEQGVVFQPIGRSARRLQLETPFSGRDWPADLHGSFCEMLFDQHRASVGGSRSVAATASDAARVCGLIEWAYTVRTHQRSFVHQRGLAEHADAVGTFRAKWPVANSVEVPDVLVTGGTGFIGGHLVERLAGEGRQMTCLVRSPATVPNLARYPVQLLQANLLDRAAVNQAIRGKREVYHLAYGRDGADAAAVTIDGTRNLVEAAIAAEVETVVVLSTAYVFGFPDGVRPVDETFPYSAYGGEYGTSKKAMERWCLKRAETSGQTKIVVLNPTNVFGPGGGAYTLLPVTLAKSGGLFWLDGGKGLCNFTYVDNLVDAILAAARTPAAHGQRLIISDGVLPWIEFLSPFVSPISHDIPSYTRAELDAMLSTAPSFRVTDLAKAIVASKEVRAIARRSPMVQWLGARPQLRQFLRVAPAAGPAWHQLAETGSQATRPTPPPWVADLYHSKQTRFSAERASAVLGWKPRIGWDEAREATLTWLRDNGHLEDATPRG